MSDPQPLAVETALDQVLEAVQLFGTALNAADRGGPAAELEAAGHQLIRSAFERVPALAVLLPVLAARVRAGVDLADDGFDIRREVTAARAGQAPS